jgi:hypothetical protein
MASCSLITYPATLAGDIFIRLLRYFIVPDTLTGADADGDNSQVCSKCIKKWQNIPQPILLRP